MALLCYCLFCALFWLIRCLPICGVALLLRDESVGLAMVCLEEWIVESIVDGIVGMIISAFLILTVTSIL